MLRCSFTRLLQHSQGTGGGRAAFACKFATVILGFITEVSTEAGIAGENILQATLHRIKGRRQGIQMKVNSSSGDGEKVGKESV